MTDDRKQNSFTFNSTEIRTVLKDIKTLAQKPDSVSEAFSRLEKVIHSSSPDMLNGLKNTFNELFLLFLPKKRKNLEDIFRKRFQTNEKPVVHKTEKPEISQIEKIERELSIGKTDSAYDMLCDLIMTSDKEYLIKNTTVLASLSSKLKPYDKKEINRLFADSTGSSLHQKPVEKKQSLKPPTVKESTIEKSANFEKLINEIKSLLKRPDRTGEAFQNLNKLILESDSELLKNAASIINETVSAFMPGKQKQLKDVLDTKIQQIVNTTDGNDESTHGDVKDAETTLERIDMLMSRPDTIADAFELLQDSIKSFSIANLKTYEENISNAINSFFPKKRRDLLRLYQGRFKRPEDAAWDIEYETLLSDIRKSASKRLNPEKSFSGLSDVIMTCKEDTLLEYRSDIQEISLFLPGNLRMNIQNILDQRTGVDDQLIDESLIHELPVTKQNDESIFEEIPLTETFADHLKSEDFDIESQPVIEKYVTDVDEKYVDESTSKSERFSYPIIHERFNFTSHAVTRTGQRGIAFDSIEMAFRYGRQELTRGAVYYVVGRNEVEEFKESVPEIIRHEGLHVVCSSEDGAIMTVFKNKDLSAIKHKKKVYTKKRKFH